MNGNGMLFAEKDLCPHVREWVNMPEYVHGDLSPMFSVVVHFASQSDAEEFADKLGIRLAVRNGRQSQSTWYPPQEVDRYANKRYISES